MWIVLALMMTGPGSLDVKTIAQGGLSGIERPRQVVVRTDQEWIGLWQEHAAEQKRPAIDFAARMVIGVFLGSKMTAGHDVAITRVEPRGSGVIVRYRESKPGPDRLTAQVITTPFHIVSVPRADGPVEFVNEADLVR